MTAWVDQLLRVEVAELVSFGGGQAQVFRDLGEVIVSVDKENGFAGRIELEGADVIDEKGLEWLKGKCGDTGRSGFRFTVPDTTIVVALGVFDVLSFNRPAWVPAFAASIEPTKEAPQ